MRSHRTAAWIVAKGFASLLLSMHAPTALADTVIPVATIPDSTAIARHFDVLQLEQYTRFNYMDDGPGIVDARAAQYRIRGRLQINLFGEGSTYLRMRAESGQGFNNSWDNTGVGLGPAQNAFYVKTLTMGQKIGSHAEIQAGGLEFDSGAGSQHTYASGDGALVGYRGLLTNQSGGRATDKISLTMGYVGDFDQANFFLRCHMGKLNYSQALVQRRVGDTGSASVEIDSIRGIWFAREAVQWDKALGRLLDNALVEAVTRTTDGPAFGWSSTVSRGLDTAKRWQAQIIYSDMPHRLYEKQGSPILLNQGEISTGKRISWGGSYAVRDKIKMEIFAGRRLDNTPTLRWTAQGGISCQYGDLVNHLLGWRQSSKSSH